MGVENEPVARLENIKLKFAWAARQAAELEAAIDTFVATADYTLNLQIEHPWSSLSFITVPPVPTDIRLLFADQVHNLRSVLDHLVWQLVDLNLAHGKPGRDVAFPVLTHASAWRDARKRQLRGFPKQWLEVIEWAQPFTVSPPSEHPAYYLHHVDIASKHRLLVGFGLTIAAIAHPEIHTNRSLGPFDRIEAVDEPGPFDLKEGEVLRRYRPVSLFDDLRIVSVGNARESQIVLGPYRDDVGFPSEAPMKNRNYVVYVGSVLEALAPAFQGT